MRKQIKPVVVSLMVLALGLSMTACGQGYTSKDNAVRVKNRIQSKSMPYRNNVTDNRVNKFDNRMDTLNYRGNLANPSRIAKQLANRADKVPGVSKATVVIHKNDAIVGIDVDNTGKKAIIEKQVYAALMGQYPEYNIHVTSDGHIHQKIRSLNVSMTNGHPLKTLANDVAIIIRNIGKTVTAPLR
ncbi:MAG TPA: YhcN/YlaJ family sporulation lipoprotein [Candidatus Udaeobacter sp.]|nr:YhcN/YlaJ family sporulation lipoprotein [Candidatus Udaeobacter sp.]